MKSLLTTLFVTVGLLVNGFAQEQPEMLKLEDSPPDFELKDLDGKTWKLSELEGKVVLLDFWYMGCPPCQLANPKVQKLHKKYSDDGLVVLGVNAVDNNDNRRGKIKPYKKEIDATYTVLLANDALIKDFKVPAYPSFYIIGKDGKIKYAQGGYHPYVYKEMKGVIKDELKN